MSSVVLKSAIIEEETRVLQELMTRMKKKAIDTEEKLKAFSIPEMEFMLGEPITEAEKEALVKHIANLTVAHDVVLEDDDLPMIKAKTMYKMVEDVDESL